MRRKRKTLSPILIPLWNNDALARFCGVHMDSESLSPANCTAPRRFEHWNNRIEFSSNGTLLNIGARVSSSVKLTHHRPSFDTRASLIVKNEVIGYLVSRNANSLPLPLPRPPPLSLSTALKSKGWTFNSSLHLSATNYRRLPFDLDNERQRRLPPRSPGFFLPPWTGGIDIRIMPISVGECCRKLRDKELLSPHKVLLPAAVRSLVCIFLKNINL